MNQAGHSVETERLRLRQQRVEDLPHSAALWADPDVVRFIGGRPLTQEDVWSRYLRHAGHWAVLGYGNWMVEEKATSQWLGEVGFLHLKREFPGSENFSNAPEIGWALTPGIQGKGYATEAASAAMAWGERCFGWTRFVCMIHPDNTPSLRVAEKCGFREYGRTIYKEAPIVLLKRVLPGHSG